jgi:hypothetical protein
VSGQAVHGNASPFGGFAQEGGARRVEDDVGYRHPRPQAAGVDLRARCGTRVQPGGGGVDHQRRLVWHVDGGFFPSSAAMNPALTIAPQALRIAAESSLAD